MAEPLQLLAVRNTVSRRPRGPVQTIAFWLRCAPLRYGKTVTVHWSGDAAPGVWHRLRARCLGPLDANSELWFASAGFSGADAPGHIHFAAELALEGRSRWDSRYGQNYHAAADSGLQLLDPALPFLVLPPSSFPARAQSLPLLVLARADVPPAAVSVRWTPDDWRTVRVSSPRFRPAIWQRLDRSAAPNPAPDGTRLLSLRLPARNVPRIEFAVSAFGHWSNRGGSNFRYARGNFRVLTLNLHTWQESDQLEKFRIIARAIQRERVDIACFQEVGELWNDGNGDPATNAANLINAALPAPRHLFQDWSHIGFNRYREGLAILSRFPFKFTDSGYVSDDTSPYTIHSRRVVMARVRLPFGPPLDVFSAHLSWPENGFDGQYDRLLAWMRARHSPDLAGTLLCGDFNTPPSSPSYQRIADLGGFEDQILKIQNPGAFHAIFRERTAPSTELLPHDGRIDHAFLSHPAPIRVISARPLFTGEPPWPPVSDHHAYLLEFEFRP